MDTLMQMNDGAPTHIQTRGNKLNPLDLSFVSPDICDKTIWQTTNDTLGSDHMVIRMPIQIGMPPEGISVRAKIDQDKFIKQLESIKTHQIYTFEDFLQRINNAKNQATINPKKIKSRNLNPIHTGQMNLGHSKNMCVSLWFHVRDK